MRLFRVKKGLDYAVLLLVITIIGIVALVVAISDQLNVVNQGIAQSQIATLNAAPEAKFVDAYISSAARFALSDAFAEYANPQAQNIPGDTCGELNTLAEPKNLTPIDFRQTINELFNAKNNLYLRRYLAFTDLELPHDNYELAITTNHIIGVPLRPVTLTLENVYGTTIGKLSYRPSFTIDIQQHPFNEYPELYLTLTIIANTCARTPNPQECAEQLSPSTWDVLPLENDRYQFTIPVDETSPCYLLYLPPEEEPEQPVPST